MEKISPQVNQTASQLTGSTPVHLWVFFKDKCITLSKAIAQPEKILSAKAIERRKLRAGNAGIDESDLPVSTSYINKIASLGCTIRQTSKWFNGISIVTTKNMLPVLAELPEVSKIDLVYSFKREKPIPEVLEKQAVSEPDKQPAGVYALDYGTAYTQLNQIKVPDVHALGYTGKGVTIAVFDAGFNRLSHESFTHLFTNSKILATHDFVNHQTSVADGTGLMGTGEHGTQTLSCIGAYKPGKLIGSAFDASFILAKTENTDSETPTEEDNWLAAVEWADSIGVDIISSSLGYDTFDSPYTSYTYANMDGKTCRITLTAAMAARKGIVVVNSASNNGYNATVNTLSAPADADSIITAGSVTSAGSRSSFSSVGNTIDGRVKPDVMAMGSSAAVASPTDDTLYTYNSGTSFSCPITAGVAALLLSAKPSLTPVAVRDALRSTASNASTPTRLMGWGIINALAAITLVTDSSYQPPVIVNNFTVYDAYPNPFNPSVTIRYDLPQQGNVKINIYDINGNLIKSLTNEEQAAGYHKEISWNGRNAVNHLVSSGTYFCRIEYNNLIVTKKLLLVK